MQDQVESQASGAVAERAAVICWRQLDGRLWAGRALDRPSGTIERRRDFVFIGLDGVQHCGYSSLEDAKAAAERSNDEWPAPQRERWYTTSVASTAGLAGLALLTTSLFAVMVAVVAERISF